MNEPGHNLLVVRDKHQYFFNIISHHISYNFTLARKKVNVKLNTDSFLCSVGLSFVY